MTTPEKLYTTEEIAVILRVHKQTVWRYIRQNKLSATKVGGQYRVKESDLEKYLNK